MTIGRDIIAQAFPNQPRMQAAFEDLVANAEDLLGRLEAAATALVEIQGDSASIINLLASKQAKSDNLTAISLLPPDPGVLEQVSPGIVSIRQVDTADTASLMTRALADTRYLGGAHAAASATKLATARTISATSDATWSVTFDGSANVSAALTLATVNSNTGSFGGAKTSVQVSLDGKGRVTSASAITITPDYSSIGIVPTSRFLGRLTAGTGSAEALTGTQATTLLDTFTSALKGLAPASGGGTTNFLRADGTWAAPSSGVTPAALTKTDDTNVTLTLGGTSASALLQAVSITVAWSGTLAVTRGGTGSGTAAGARTNLGLGTAATQNTGTSGANLGLLNTQNTYGALQILSSGYSGFFNDNTGSYTLQLGDAGAAINCHNAGARTITIPPNSSVAFPIGTRVWIFSWTGATTTIGQGSGVSLFWYAGTGTPAGPANRSLVDGSWCVIHKINTDTWAIMGQGIS